MIARQIKIKGFSLVEVLIGITVLIVVLASGLLALKSLTRAVTSNILNFRVDRKLQSTADDMRRESIGMFSTMASQYRVCASGCPDLDPKITIWADIGSVDSLSRTRPVTLTATWNDGISNHSKTSNFALSPLRGKIYGGTVRVKVVWGNNPNAGGGVEGVKVTAASQELSTPVSNYTGADGTCELGGVRLTGGTYPTVDINLSGVGVGYFANNPSFPDTANGGRWERTVTLNNITPSTPVSVPNQTLFHLTSISGQVNDVATSSGASKVLVSLRSRLNQLVIPDGGTIMVNDQVTSAASGQEGTFAFPDLIPGQYSLHVIGDVDHYYYAAVAAQNDRDSSLRTYFSANSGVGVSGKILKTAERGNLSFSVRAFNYTNTGAKSATIVSPNAPFKIGFWSRNAYTYRDWNATFVPMDKTIPWSYSRIQDYSAPGWSQIPWVTVDNSNNGVVTHLLPNILIDVSTFSPTRSLLEQYGKADLLVDYRPTFNNATPVLIVSDGGTLQTSRVRYFYDDPYDDTTVPGNPDSQLTESIHSGGLAASNTGRIYNILGSASFGNISGRVVYSGSLANFDQTPGWSYVDSQVKRDSWQPLSGWGYLEKSGGMYRILSNRQISVMADKCSFDFAKPSGSGSSIGNTLPPTVGSWVSGTDDKFKTTLTYHGGSSSNISKFFNFQIQGFEKVYSGGAILEHAFTTFSPSANLTMRFYDGSAPWVGWTSLGTAGMSTDSQQLQRTVSLDTQWAGQSAPTVVKPGETTSPVLIPVTSYNTYRAYYVAIDDNASWAFQKPAGSGNKGYLYEYITGSDDYRKSGTVPFLVIQRKGRTGTITGVVRDGGTSTTPKTPLANATVTLWRSGGYSDQTTMTNNSGVYTFNNIDFVMAQGTNITITVTMPKYYGSGTLPTFAGQSYEGGAYQGMNYTFPDIVLWPDPTNVGGGGQPRL